jgi:hypothetical protein
MLSAEQQQVLTYLRSSPGAWFSAMEVSRRAGTRKQFEEEPRWAVNCLRYLLDMKLVERNGSGHYKFFDPEAQKKEEAETH